MKRTFWFAVFSPSDKINMAFIGVGAQGFRRWHEATHLLFRNQPWILAVESAENLAMIADEQKPLVILVSALEGNIFCQLLGARRHQPAVVPREPDGRHVASGWELVAHNRSQRISFFIAIAGARFHRRWGLELQHAEGGVEAVGAHVAECAAAEVGPSAPGKRQINMIEWAFRRRAEPQVPIQSGGHRILLLRALDALQPEGAARPVLYLLDRADHAGPDPLTEQARVFGSLVGDGDLRGDSGLLRHFRHAPRFVDRVSQRFLPENLLALLHRGNGILRVKLSGRDADD